MFRLDNKVAIVTGGGSGIGRAIAETFAQQGATVYIIDFAIEAANDVAKLITKNGLKCYALQCDVSNQQDVINAINSIANIEQRVDILINNAGIAHIGTAVTTAEVDFNRLMQINVNGVYNCLHATLPHMINNGGVVLNMASIASSVGITDRFAYSTTKGAVVGMTYATARDFIKHNIRCNCISPARVHTPFVDGFIEKNYPGQETEMFEKLSKSQPIGRMAKPVEIAHLALYLCSDEAGFITGCDYPIDGGFIKLNN